MICKNCGKEFEGKFCPDCGTMVEDQSQQDLTQCPNCGTERVDNGKFCVNCGYNFVDPTQSVIVGKTKLSLNNVKLNKFLGIFAKVYRWLIAGGMIFVGIVSLLCLTAPVITESFLGESNPLCSGFVAIGGGVDVDVPSNVVNVCITLLVVSIFCVLYGAAQLSIAFQEPYSKIKNKVFWIIDGAISIVLIILGSVVAGEAGSEELMDAKLGSGFAMCIVMGVFGLVFLGLRIFYELKLFKWEDTGLTEEQIAKATEKKERKPIDKEKVKKIAIRVGIPVVVIAVLIAVIVPTVAWANNIFRVGKVDKINIGDSQEQVIKILGEPYDKSDNRFEYYSNDYIKLVEQIKKLTGNSKNLTTNMAKDDDWDIDWDEDIDFDEDMGSSESKLEKLYNQLNEMTYKYIRVDFDRSKKVREVFFDNNRCDSKNKDKIANKFEVIKNNNYFYTEYNDGGIYKCKLDGDIVIPSGVTSISDNAFYECSSLTSVKIPSGVESIGWGAFAGCSSLTSIEIPNSIISIAPFAFNECSSLVYNKYDNGLYLGNKDNPYLVLAKAKNENISSCKINENTKFIDTEAFRKCSRLISIEIPSSVTSIGRQAFEECRNLTSIEIPSGVTSIGSYAFSFCSNLTIYCEAESQPSGWGSYWNYSNRPVVWGYKG